MKPIASSVNKPADENRVAIMTNNPRKIYGLEGFGLRIVERVGLEMPAHEHNRDYLRAKKDKLGHLLENL